MKKVKHNFNHNNIENRIIVFEIYFFSIRKISYRYFEMFKSE